MLLWFSCFFGILSYLLCGMCIHLLLMLLQLAPEKFEIMASQLKSFCTCEEVPQIPKIKQLSHCFEFFFYNYQLFISSDLWNNFNYSNYHCTGCVVNISILICNFFMHITTRWILIKYMLQCSQTHTWGHRYRTCIKQMCPPREGISRMNSSTNSTATESAQLTHVAFNVRG